MKRLGGWIIKDKLFAQIKVSTELWYFARRDGSNEKQVTLFFVGWYEAKGQAKLFTINILWISVQIGMRI